jgi:hypothetical protein
MKVGKPVDLESLLKEIYVNSTERKEKINKLLETLSNLVTDIPSAVNLMPDVTKLQQVAVQNDDALIKLAMVVVKSSSKKVDKDDDMFALSDVEYKQLMSKAKQAADTQQPSSGK